MLCQYLMTLMLSGVFSHSVTRLSTSVIFNFLPLKPVYSKKSTRTTPWFIPEIVDTIKLKNKAKHSFEKAQLVSDKARFRSLKNNLKSTELSDRQSKKIYNTLSTISLI